MAFIDTKDLHMYNEDIFQWGFTENHCFHCGKTNSEISGLLMQCGKCKKVYYCSNKCFNDGLEEHQKTCSTGASLLRQPVASTVAASKQTTKTEEKVTAINEALLITAKKKKKKSKLDYNDVDVRSSTEDATSPKEKINEKLNEEKCKKPKKGDQRKTDSKKKKKSNIDSISTDTENSAAVSEPSNDFNTQTHNQFEKEDVLGETTSEIRKQEDINKIEVICDHITYQEEQSDNTNKLQESYEETSLIRDKSCVIKKECRTVLHDDENSTTVKTSRNKSGLTDSLTSDNYESFTPLKLRQTQHVSREVKSHKPDWAHSRTLHKTGKVDELNKKDNSATVDNPPAKAAAKCMKNFNEKETAVHRSPCTVSLEKTLFTSKPTDLTSNCKCKGEMDDENETNNGSHYPAAERVVLVSHTENDSISSSHLILKEPKLIERETVSKKPSWTSSISLRKTEKGKILKINGDLVSPGKPDPIPESRKFALLKSQHKSIDFSEGFKMDHEKIDINVIDSNKDNVTLDYSNRSPSLTYPAEQTNDEDSINLKYVAGSPDIFSTDDNNYSSGVVDKLQKKIPVNNIVGWQKPLLPNHDLSKRVNANLKSKDINFEQGHSSCFIDESESKKENIIELSATNNSVASYFETLQESQKVQIPAWKTARLMRSMEIKAKMNGEEKKQAGKNNFGSK